MGVKNCITINLDGKKMANYNMLFDKVLLDAPCSGLGVISRDPSIKTRKMYSDITKCSHL